MAFFKFAIKVFRCRMLCISCQIALAFGVLVGSIDLAFSQTFRELQLGKSTREEIYALEPKIRELADQGDAEAQYFLYIVQRSGYKPFSKDVNRALAYLEASADAGYRAALTEVSGQYFWGEYRKIDIYKAQKYYELANQTPFILPFDEGATLFLPRSYKAIIPPTYHMLKRDSEFMKLVDAAVLPAGGEAAYQAGLYLKKYFFEDTSVMDYFYQIAASHGHAEGTMKHGEYIYHGSGGLTSAIAPAEARAIFAIAADLGSEKAKSYLRKYKYFERVKEEKRQAFGVLIATFSALVASSQDTGVNQSQRDYEARQRQLQYGINTDSALGLLPNW